MAGIVLLFGIGKASLSFSSWKSEGNRTFDNSDVFSIYSEIVNSISSRRKTKIILVEDIDRIGDSRTILTFLKEVYRFNTLTEKGRICFIIAIKPRVLLEKDIKEDAVKELDYNKIFDFIIELKPIHVDDYFPILIDANLLIKLFSNTTYREYLKDDVVKSHARKLMEHCQPWYKRAFTIMIKTLSNQSA